MGKSGYNLSRARLYNPRAARLACHTCAHFEKIYIMEMQYKNAMEIAPTLNEVSGLFNVAKSPFYRK